MRAWRAVLAWGVFTLVCLLTAAGGWWSSQTANGDAQPFDAVLALAFTATGAMIVTRRANRLGWLALTLGLSAVAYAADSYTGWAGPHHAGGAGGSAWVAQWVWAPPTLILVIVLPLLVPDGRLPSPRWRSLLVADAIAIAGFTTLATLPAPPAAFPVALIVLLGLSVAGLTGLVVRLRRAVGTVRLQLVWICAGAALTVVAVFGGVALPAPWVDPVQAIGALCLPAAVGVAVLRHNLYDIDPLLRRGLTYGLLVAALGLLALGVTSLGGLMLGGGRTALTVVATIAIGLAVNPFYRVTTRAVDRTLYGRRGDPYAELAALDRRLAATADPNEVLRAVAEAVAALVRSPFVMVEPAGGLPRVTAGPAQATTTDIPLIFHGSDLGWLRLAPRAPAEPFDPRDNQLLHDAAARAGAAVCAAVTELDLRAARARLVDSREEERRRLRHDLHDGVGPILAGLGFTAEAAARALPGDPARAAQLLSSVHEQASTAVAAVRRISRDLGPAGLADLGLAEAITRLTEPLTEAGIAVAVTLAPLPAPLTAAVEVATYHVAAEAIANALRHSQADRIVVELADADGRLTLRVSDNGIGIATVRPGVGLASMRQRAEELGGRWSISSADEAGTTVELSLPLAGVAR